MMRKEDLVLEGEVLFLLFIGEVVVGCIVCVVHGESFLSSQGRVPLKLQ